MNEGCPQCDRAHSRDSPDCPAKRVGEIIDGRYRLDLLLGVGGCGCVYRAQHVHLDRAFAVKTLLPALARDELMAARFLREARASAALEHPGIVDVTDYGTDDQGRPYLVMELLRGESLADWLAKQGRLQVDRALTTILDVLDALTVAHKAGIVHRDIKPSNIFCIDPREGVPLEVKLVDFGLAKLTESDGATQLTTHGSFLGTAVYASPEQIESPRNVDQRSDLYSLGAVLFALLTGTHPVGRNDESDGESTLGEVLSRVLRGEIERRPSKVRPGVAPWLDTLVEKSLALEPADRFQSAEEMADEIEKVRMGQSGSWATRGEIESQAVTRVDSSRALVMGDDRPPPPDSAERKKINDERWARAAGIGAIVVLILAAGFVILKTASRSDLLSQPHTQVTSPEIPAGMIRISGAAFRMGSTPEEVARAFRFCQDLGLADCSEDLYQRESPPRDVTVSPFLIDRTEVTNEVFAGWMSGLDVAQLEIRDEIVLLDGQPILDLHSEYGGVTQSDDAFATRAGRHDLPVIQVTWNGANTFCRDRGGRLPTEAEWELAARGPERRRFPWGTEPPRCDGVVFGRAPNSHCSDAGIGPQIVGTAAEDLTTDGVHDLGGNVSEWTADIFVAPYPACFDDCLDSTVDSDTAASTEGSKRVFRGGNWNNAAEMTRTAGRSRAAADMMAPDVGFRCVESIEEPTRGKRATND